MKNRYRKLLMLVLFIAAISNGYAQVTYAVTNQKDIYIVNSDYSTTYLCTAGPTEYLINDIAISPSGQMYAIAYNSLYRIDLPSGLATWLADFPPNFYVSLVCGSDNALYTINNLQKTLYKYDLSTNVLTNVAYLGYETSGDLAFYKGHLIFQTYNDSGSVYMVKAVNLESGALSDIMCQPFYFQLWGLANYAGCNGEVVVGVNPANEFLEIDFGSQTYTTHPFNLPEGQTIYGLARSDESLYSECPVQDIPDLNCELGIDEYRNGTAVISPNPVTNMLNIANRSAVYEVDIFNSLGQLVLQLKGNELESVDVSNLTKGIYFLEVKSADGTSTIKFLKD